MLSGSCDLSRSATDPLRTLAGSSTYSSKGQEVLQPGATPFREQRRYLGELHLRPLTVSHPLADTLPSSSVQHARLDPGRRA